MTQLLVAYTRPSENLLVAIAGALRDPGLVGLISLDEIAVFLHDTADAEFAQAWAPQAESVSDTILVVPPGDLRVLAKGGLEFRVGRVIRLEVDGGGEISAIASVVEATCDDFAVRVGAHDLGWGDPKVCEN